jgi:hypothetical protein
MEPTQAPSPEQAGGSSLPPGQVPPIEAPAREPAPETGAASPERPGSWLRTALAAVTGRGTERTQDGAPADEHAPGTQPDAEEWSPPAWATKREYDDWLYSEQRRFADRQDRDRERRAAREREGERDQQIAALERQKEEARASGDTWRVGELQDEIDATRAGIGRELAQSQALTDFVGNIRAEFDTLYLDPVLRELPSGAARKLLDEHSAKDEKGALVIAPDGQPLGIVTTEARAALFTGALKAIKDAARDQGRADARTDPVLRKELMAEFVTTPEADETIPIQVGAARNGSGAGRDMNEWIRSVRNRT